MILGMGSRAMVRQVQGDDARADQMIDERRDVNETSGTLEGRIYVGGR